VAKSGYRQPPRLRCKSSFFAIGGGNRRSRPTREPGMNSRQKQSDNELSRSKVPHYFWLIFSSLPRLPWQRTTKRERRKQSFLTIRCQGDLGNDELCCVVFEEWVKSGYRQPQRSCCKSSFFAIGGGNRRSRPTREPGMNSRQKQSDNELWRSKVPH